MIGIGAILLIVFVLYSILGVANGKTETVDTAQSAYIPPPDIAVVSPPLSVEPIPVAPSQIIASDSISQAYSDNTVIGYEELRD